MEAPAEAELNTSCRKISRSHAEIFGTDSVLTCFIIINLVLNLLVIISISHFRQLHTTTNLLLLSLAMADLFVGLVLMPIQLLVSNHGCTVMCSFMCSVHWFSGFLFIGVSVGSMVLISVDRYIAICQPMFYSTRVTLPRVKLCICLCWLFSGIHGGWILRDSLLNPDFYNPCSGECFVIIRAAEATFDLFLSFIGPILLIVILYLRVFVVAVSQARAMRSQITATSLGRPERIKVEKSEIKAARTLGIVVLVFIFCSLPYYSFTLAAESGLVGSSSVNVEIWLLYLNSTFNPVIYVFFYPWFRKGIKHIFTLQILKAGSREVSLM